MRASTKDPFKRIVVSLSVLVLVLVVFVTICSLSAMSDGSGWIHDSVRGEKVMIFGKGLYGHDTVLTGSGFVGQDLVSLLLAIPVLLTAIIGYAMGDRRGKFLLYIIMAYFLYVYASMSLAASYNQLFLLYVLLFSAAFYCFALLFQVAELELSASGAIAQLPRRSLAIFMFLSGTTTFVVWVLPLMLAGMGKDFPDHLGHYTTLVTHALDIAVIVPATFIAGLLVLKRSPSGYVISLALLGLLVMLLPLIVLSTWLQIINGISFSAGEIIGPISGFLVLGGCALWFLLAVLQRLPINTDEESSQNNSHLGTPGSGFQRIGF